MNEQEMIIRAKSYIDKLANGIDPISGDMAPDNDVINNVKVSRCLFYVSGILQKVIDNGGNITKTGSSKSQKTKKTEFLLTPEELNKFEFSERPIPISEIARRINNCKEQENMVQLSYKVLTEYLIDSGILQLKQSPNGNSYKGPTEIGETLGIHEDLREGTGGNYYVTLYDAGAQHFLIDNLPAIIEWKHHADRNIDITRESK